MKAFYKYEIGKRTCILFILLYVAVLSKGQCPDKLVLEKCLAQPPDSAKSYSQRQFIELSGYMDKMQNCPYRNDSTHARLVRRIGAVYFLRGDYLNAIRYFRQSVNIITANANKPSVNLTDLPASYFWLSEMYGALNMVDERMKALDSCYKIAMKIPYIDAACLQALYKRGQYFFDVGDYRRCIEYMQQCNSFAKQYPTLLISHQREEFISGSLLWQTKALLELKDYKGAEGLLTDRIEECKRGGLTKYLGTILSQLAELQLRKGNAHEALSFYSNALKNDQQAGYNFGCKQTLKDIGYNIYFIQFNDVNKALTYYARALRTINNSPNLYGQDRSETLDLFRLIGNAFAEKDQFDSAYRYFQLAFDQIHPGTGEESVLHGSQEAIKQFKKIHYLTSLIIDKADAHRKQYEATRQPKALQEATRIYKTADLFLEKIRTEQSDLQSKLFWREDSRRLYENAIAACYLQNNPSDAFYFFERSRAVLLSDQLNEQHWLGEQDILKQTQLQKKIQQLERNINVTDKSSRQYADLRDELFSSKQELDKLQDAIKINNPLYYQSFVEKAFITLDDVRQKLLKDHQALVEIFAGDSAIYSLVVTVGKTYLQKINKPVYDSLPRVYSGFISHAERLNKDFNGFVQVSHQLYQLLFNTVNLPPGRIIISPDGQSFPFEALITDAKTRNYFLYDHAVSYTYSARYLLNEFNQNISSSSKIFFGIAPVQYSNGLPALEGSDESLYRMQKYFRKARTLVLSKASKNNFLNQFASYGIIQLYAHATDSGYNGEPTIDFSDSTLSLSDLFYSKKPATNLIVLSACETALGEVHPGEGVFSFNRGFAALGIPSAVSNLWQVDNEATYRLTELFYKYVANGIPLDIALQKAKKEFMQTAVSSENKLPYYWAASILVGQSNEIILRKPFPWKWVGALGILLMLGFFGWRFKRGDTSTQFGIKGKFLRE